MKLPFFVLAHEDKENEAIASPPHTAGRTYRCSPYRTHHHGASDGCFLSSPLRSAAQFSFTHVHSYSPLAVFAL